MPDSRSSPGSGGDGPASLTSRRRVLAGLGAGIATGAAGCSDVTGERRPYEDGSVGDVEGEPRTAEEMTAAEAVAEQETNVNLSPLDALSIVEHEFVLEDDYRGPTVKGTLENAGGDLVRRVEIRVRVYGHRDQQLDLYLTSTGDLAGGARWEFEVVLLEAPADIGSYEVLALGSPT